MSNLEKVVILDGSGLSAQQLFEIGYNNYKIDLSDNAWKNVRNSRKVIEDVLERKQIVYGINTGFGNFANVIIPEDKLQELQNNLIRSHASGVGNPISIERTRMLCALRVNILAKGYSGISEETLSKYIANFNANCMPRVPEKGTVGASGDLAPLAHLCLGMMGEGEMYNPNTGKLEKASKVLSENKLSIIELKPKEGLALINGTQFITSLGAEALVRSRRIAKQGNFYQIDILADCIAAVTVEALHGSLTPFHPSIHAIRPHSGQGLVAARIRAILTHDENHKIIKSEVTESHANCSKVQDAYSLRCIPQVHGIVNNTIDFVSSIIEVELNSATDNPIIFADLPFNDDNDNIKGRVMSGGNFHGEYPAKALDYLAIGVHELASISERRIERLVNGSLSSLPPFLVKDGGVNSGFMIAHCTAAALVSENKVLCHPASVDSQSTSAAQEDHVSMGGFAARKACELVFNVENVLAIELLAACQGLDFYNLKSSCAVEAVRKLVRDSIPNYSKDRFFTPDIEYVAQLIRENKIWNVMKPYIPDELHRK